MRVTVATYAGPDLTYTHTNLALLVEPSPGACPRARTRLTDLLGIKRTPASRARPLRFPALTVRAHPFYPEKICLLILDES